MQDIDDNQGAGRDRRIFPRNTVIWTGSLRVEGAPRECVILNVSANGAKLRFADPVDVDDPNGVLRIPRLGEFKAHVTWTKKNTMGVRFDEPPERVAELVAEILPQARQAS